MPRILRGAPAGAPLTLLRWLVAAFALPVLPWHTARAQSAPYPDRPIRIVVGFPAGSSVDVRGRLYAKAIGDALGQPVIVENKPGASGLIGVDAVGSAAPDGYTLLFGGSNDMAAQPALGRKGRHDPASFLPIAVGGIAHPVLLVTPSLGVRSVAELASAAQRQPGGLGCAAGGIASTYHFVCVYLSKVTGAPLNVVQYKGSTPALTDVASGHVHVGSGYPSEIVQPFTSTGKLVPIAVLSPRRLRGFEQVPTMAEATGTAVELPGWNGLFAPPGTPAMIVERLSEAMRAAGRALAGTPSFRDGGTEVPDWTPAQFAEFVRFDRARWIQRATETGITADP